MSLPGMFLLGTLSVITEDGAEKVTDHSEGGVLAGSGWSRGHGVRRAQGETPVSMAPLTPVSLGYGGSSQFECLEMHDVIAIWS